MLSYWLWLMSFEGIGARTAAALLERFGTPEEIYRAPASALSEVVDDHVAQLLQNKDLREADRILQDCYLHDVHILTIQDAAYPQRLRTIDDPPQVLYYQGKLPQFDALPTIAAVGTRKCSGYGLLLAKQLGYQLGQYGVIVVSGGAGGIDTLCLQGALGAGAPVVAVLGCGVDIAYPRFNADLFADIRARGCLMSEYPPGTPPMREHFPVRNRILSGLSNGVLVVEAPEKSGALITAHHALEQGRDVFTVPGNIGNDCCGGNLQLLKEGAILVTDAWDILKEYAYLYRGLTKKDHSVRQMTLSLHEQAEFRHADLHLADSAGAPTGSDRKDIDKPRAKAYIDVQESLEQHTPDERAVLLTLTEGPVSVDAIIERTQLPAGRVLSALTLLEVHKWIKRLPARRYELAEKE